MHEKNPTKVTVIKSNIIFLCFQLKYKISDKDLRRVSHDSFSNTRWRNFILVKAQKARTNIFRKIKSLLE